ncbi:MAG TPA: protealysin inhibitor emfourin [Pyrinomonadaceae bacterium]|nr:protealysin inhibitor emfourin [Pyrinomonadaceae bacterium]
MKVEFSRSGGFAAPAMKQSIEIDTDDLPESEADELRALISNAGIENLGTPATTSRQPDAFHYRIKVSDKGLSHTATTSDAEMPEALHSLLDWLTDRALRKD